MLRVLYVVEQQGGVHGEGRVDRGRNCGAALLGDDSRRYAYCHGICRHWKKFILL